MSGEGSVGARVGGALAWTLVAALTILVSAVVHLSSPIGRVAAAELTEDVADTRIRGTLHIGAITQLDFGGATLRDVQVSSRGGELLASIDRLRCSFSLLESARRGAILLAPCEMVGGRVLITRGPADQIALVDALEPRAGSHGVPVLMKRVRMSHQTITVALPGMPIDVEMGEVGGAVELTLGDHFVARMSRLHGVVGFPVANVSFERLSGRLRGGHAVPLVARMVLSLAVIDPGVAITYAAPRAVGRTGGPHFGIELGADVPDPAHLATHRASPLHAASDTRAH